MEEQLNHNKFFLLLPVNMCWRAEERCPAGPLNVWGAAYADYQLWESGTTLWRVNCALQNSNVLMSSDRLYRKSKVVKATLELKDLNIRQTWRDVNLIGLNLVVCFKENGSYLTYVWSDCFSKSSHMKWEGVLEAVWPPDKQLGQMLDYCLSSLNVYWWILGNTTNVTLQLQSHCAFIVFHVVRRYFQFNKRDLYNVGWNLG